MLSSYCTFLALFISLVNANAQVEASSQHSLRRAQSAVFGGNLLAPAPSPTTSVSFVEEEDNKATTVPTLAPIVTEYWNVVGDGFYRPPAVDQDTQDIPADAASTMSQLEEEMAAAAAAADQDNGNPKDADENNANTSDDKDKTALILVACLVSVAAISCIAVLVLLLKARRDRATVKAAKIPKAITTDSNNGETHDQDHTVDATETDREFEEHPYVQELWAVTESDSETSSV